TVLGEDVVLTLDNLKKQYGALGSYLHTPTLSQIDDPGAHSPVKLRKRIEACVKFLDEVLGSPVWNFTIGQFSEEKCLRCETMIRRRLHKDGKPIVAICPNRKCHAEYLVQMDGNKVAWTAYRQELPCPTDDCTATMILWKDEVKEGHKWTCESCGKAYH
ncbi:hypothetical protein QWZ14_12150, partial [Paeniroseomonas aquatica]